MTTNLTLKRVEGALTPYMLVVLLLIILLVLVTHVNICALDLSKAFDKVNRS